MSLAPRRYPAFKDLPIQDGAPPSSAWGVFDKDGKKDVYGTLNFATPEAVVAAKAEILTGESVVLNLPLHLPHNVTSTRQHFEHTFISGAFGMAVCDDEIRINTQASSQWDGLLHVANQERRQYYNGFSYKEAAEDRTDRSLGIQSWSDRGGIVARGILLDFVRYASKHNIEYDVTQNYPISFDQIKTMITEEKLDIRSGDVLLVRCGLSKWIRASAPDSEEVPFKNCIGVDMTPQVIEWLWDTQFAAIGSDAVAFECWPAPDGSALKFHLLALPGWGMPIGELLDLEAIAEICEKNQRWSFFLTVCPLNVDGGVATLSNTLAIF